MSAHSLTYSAPWEDYKSYLPYVLVYIIYFGFNTKNIKMQGIFKLLSVIYFQNMCILTCDF